MNFWRHVKWIVCSASLTYTYQRITTMGKPRLWCHPCGLLFVCIILTVGFLVCIWQDLLTTQNVFTPSPISVSPLYPSNLRLLDLMDFSYVINNDVCGAANVFITVIIHTHPANRVDRDTMRQNIPSEDLLDLGIRRVFLLGRAEWNDQKLYQKTPQWRIDEENVKYRDIVQGNFKEHYHNLTYKHVMGLQWATHYCPQSKFVLKMDDDIVVDLYQYRDYLKSRYRDRENLILGLLQVEGRPMRHTESKWFVSKDEFPGDFYDPFMSGWAYAMTMDAARAIVAESAKWPYFWIDDVHVTGTLAEKRGVRREGLNRFYTLHVDHLHCCVELANSTEYYCDFFAGPSEGDPNVQAKLLRHARSCYLNRCQRRPPERSVARTCVRQKVAPLAPLGKGHGEIVRIYGPHL